MVSPNEDNVKRTRREHPGEGSDAIADGERVCGVVPEKGNRRVGSFFVVVVVVFVFVKREASACARINADFDGVLRFFGREFFLVRDSQSRALFPDTPLAG